MRASIDLDAGLGQPILDLRLQVLGDCGRVAAQRDLILFVRVVLVARRQVAHRRFGLHLDEVLIVVDLEHRFGGVDHAPDDDRGDLDRVAFEVVDLQARALEVAHAERNALLGVERVRPAQPGVLHGADVVAEQLQDAALVRVDDEQSGSEEELGDDRRTAR